MQLLPHQQVVGTLRELASAGLELLATNQIALLVERYGYAVSHGRYPVDAVQADLAHALFEACGSELERVPSHALPVLFYRPDATGLRAAIDCEIPTRGGKSIWVSFVVTGTDTSQFLTLEDICYTPGPD